MKRLLVLAALALMSLALCSRALATHGGSSKRHTNGESDTWQWRLEDFRSTGEPNQQFALSFMGVIPASVEIKIGQVPWLEVMSFADSQPESEHFVAHTDDSGITWIVFGDGLHGAIPPTGETVSAHYVAPEPSSVLALSAGLLGVLGLAWRKRR